MEDTGDGSVGTSLCVYKCTLDHFLKNAFNRMRVHLATQITSQSTCRLIDDSDGSIYTKDELSPMREIVSAVDKMIDIMNAKSDHNGVKRDGEKINSPLHRHITELLEISALFSDWNEECGIFKEIFTTRESDKNLTWMVAAVVGVSTMQLKTDYSCVLDQGRSGSNC